MIRAFMRASIQQESAHRANFVIGALHSLLNFGTGVLGLVVIFEQVETVRGWDFAATLAVLGVYLTVSALRSLFISPSLDALAGMDGEVWQGTLDFTLLRPVDVQFLASVRHWQPFALLDLTLGLGVLAVAITQLGGTLAAAHLLTFSIALGAGLLVLYAVLLAFTGLVFWSPGFLFTWVFDGVFQMARYPVGLYPGGLRLVLTWIVPVGVITTVPARALTGDLPAGLLIGSLVLAGMLVAGASILFRTGLRRYASASS
jgi:ABC-2 type transport system permease protein